MARRRKIEARCFYEKVKLKFLHFEWRKNQKYLVKANFTFLGTLRIEVFIQQPMIQEFGSKILTALAFAWVRTRD